MDAVESKPRGNSELYAWVVLLAAFLCFGVVFGTVTYAFTIFVNPIAKAFNISPTRVVLGFTLVNIGTGVLGIFAGRLLARFPIRNVMVGGLLALSAGFFALSHVTAIWQFYLVYSLIVAFGAAIVAPMGASSVVANWFATNRGRALTIATLGTSFGQLLIPPFAAQMIESGGWPSAYRAFAMILLAVAVPVGLILVDHPSTRDQKADAASPEATVEPAAILSNREILGRSDFWIILFSYLMTVIVYLGLVATIVPYARTFGVSPVQAAQLTATMGIAAIVGKIGFATFTDRMGLRNTFWIAISLNLVALVLMLTVPGYSILIAASALIGGSAGGVLPVWPGLVAFRFGPRALPQVMGLMSPIVISLQGFGAPLVTGMQFHGAFPYLIASLVVSAFLSRNLSKAAA